MLQTGQSFYLRCYEADNFGFRPDAVHHGYEV